MEICVLKAATFSVHLPAAKRRKNAPTAQAVGQKRDETSNPQGAKEDSPRAER
jgi:hypothetical protein